MAVNALQKHLDSKITFKKAEDDLIGFNKIPVLADGLCFWHSLLRCTLPEEYNPVDRVASGGPRNKDRLKYEIDLAKTAHEECLKLLQNQPNPDPDLLSTLRDCPQVHIQYVQNICNVSGLALRISLSSVCLPCFRYFRRKRASARRLWYLHRKGLVSLSKHRLLEIKRTLEHHHSKDLNFLQIINRQVKMTEDLYPWRCLSCHRINKKTATECAICKVHWTTGVRHNTQPKPKHYHDTSWSNWESPWGESDASWAWDREKSRSQSRGRTPQTPKSHGAHDGSVTPRARKGKGKGKDKGKDKSGKDGTASGVEGSSFAPLAKELPAWPTLDNVNANLQSAQPVINSAALARDQEAVRLLKQAYSDPTQMPQESKDFIERVEKETAKTVTRSLHSTTTAMDRAHKALTEATEAKKLHRQRWANHLSEAIKVWEGQLHDYRLQQSNFQEVITRARSDIETYRATIQGLTAKASPPSLAAAVPPLQVDVEDLTGESEMEEDRLQKQLQSVFRNSMESLGISMTTIAEIPEEDMDDKDLGPDTKKRPRSLEPFPSRTPSVPAAPTSPDPK
eukprot:s918_g14.t1